MQHDLDLYLKNNKITNEQFGKMLKPPVTFQTVSGWRHNAYKPCAKNIKQIENITSGEVNLSSFFPD